MVSRAEGMDNNFSPVAFLSNAGHGILILKVINHTPRRTTICRIPLDECSARRRDLYLILNNTHRRQTPMPSAGFEPTIPAGKRPQTQVLDSAATGTGMDNIGNAKLSLKT
jgi:hypothetical protein